MGNRNSIHHEGILTVFDIAGDRQCSGRRVEAHSDQFAGTQPRGRAIAIRVDGEQEMVGWVERGSYKVVLTGEKARPRYLREVAGSGIDSEDTDTIRGDSVASETGPKRNDPSALMMSCTNPSTSC
jgi:hypothetical protein